MAQLHHLLQEDQEPFHLHEYIADRRTKLRTNSSQNNLHLTRITKPLNGTLTTATSSSRNSSIIHFPVTFCKNACFNVNNVSPDLNRASPVPYIPKSPVELLHIPSKTAALLLQAAVRIHKTAPSRKHTHGFSTDCSFFGSVLKKLSVKTHKRNHINPTPQTTSSSGFRFGKVSGDSNHSEEVLMTLIDSDMDFCCNRRSNAVSSEGKSLDTETSCSSSNNSDMTRIVRENTRSPSRCPAPDFSVKDADEEEKEQYSPVCVLDPQFEEDENDHHNDDGGYGHQCSYAIVQNANLKLHNGCVGKKQQLLHKLSRFEALADFDPKDIEKLILEEELYDEADLEMLDENDGIVSEISSVPADEFLIKVLEKCGFHDLYRIPIDMKRLVSDLIAEEENEDELLDYSNDVANTVCGRFSSWREVEQNTIDMMVCEDFKQESCKWNTNQEESSLVAMDIELGVYASSSCEIGNPLNCQMGFGSNRTSFDPFFFILVLVEVS